MTCSIYIYIYISSVDLVSICLYINIRTYINGLYLATLQILILCLSVVIVKGKQYISWKTFENSNKIARKVKILPIGSLYGIYANIWGILLVNVTIYSIHGSYGL